ncbi:transketolase C-terminal domain-containing protein [Streptomyces sp. NPDC006984]|uniref:transketolase-like TK C-terminal-containing protein n=1 Tax=Streptomyces sp. NPDC006984 TaxID=3155463 RepID=UPI0033F8AA2E
MSSSRGGTTPRPFERTDPERRCADTARAPAVDAVEAAGRVPPGTAVSPAPAARLLRRWPSRHRPAGSGAVAADGVARGGYVLADAPDGEPEVVLLAAGGEVRTALAARRLLLAEGIGTRVVAMPRPEWFREQSEEYRESVLPNRARARVSVEAGSALGWYQLLGDAGMPVGLDRLCAGAPAAALFEQHGFSPARVAAAARASLARAGRGEHR